jgi:hypothetical protein
MKKDYLEDITKARSEHGYYKILPDGSVDIYRSVCLGNCGIKRLVIKFHTIHEHPRLSYSESGSFDVCHNELTSLENFPEVVSGNVYIHNNKKQFTVDEVRSVCKVNGSIHV